MREAIAPSERPNAPVRSSSPNNFTVKGGLSVTSPVGTDVWKVGEAKTISWTSTGAGAIPTVNLEYSKNGLFTDTVVIATGVASGPTGGSYAWTVADAIATTVKIRVKHPTDTTVSADSAAFTIKGTLTLTAPVGGEAWTAGSSQNITWTRTGSIANVKSSAIISNGLICFHLNFLLAFGFIIEKIKL